MKETEERFLTIVERDLEQGWSEAKWSNGHRAVQNPNKDKSRPSGEILIPRPGKMPR